MFDPIRPTKTGRFPQVIASHYFQGVAPAVWYGSVPLGNGTQYRIACFRTRNGVFVAIENRGAYEFGGAAHPGYVRERLGLRFDGDARNIADFINCQLGVHVDIAPFGTYEESLCLKD